MTLSLQVMQQLFDNLFDGVYLVDTEQKIIYWNQGAERITGYRAEEVLGVGCAEGFLCHVDEQGQQLCCGGCLLQAALEQGLGQEKELFLLHRQGHRVPVQVRVTALRDARGTIIGAAQIFSDISRRYDALRRAREFESLAMNDALTGIANRRYLDIKLRESLEETAFHGRPFGILFVDIDRFKPINDTFGHLIGDEVIRMVARTLVGNLRASDFVGRWGGEEFLVLVPHIDAAMLEALAKKIRALVESSALPSELGPIRVTVSIGATLATVHDTPESCVRRADDLAYRSKAAGRNSVTIDFAPSSSRKIAG